MLRGILNQLGRRGTTGRGTGAATPGTGSRWTGLGGAATGRGSQGGLGSLLRGLTRRGRI